jgi:hypothetical protein
MKKAICILRNTSNWGTGIHGLTGYELCVQLTRGYVSLIDADDLVAMSSHNWFALVHKARVYAVRKTPRDVHGKKKTIYLHREIMNPLPTQEVDHRDQHKLFRYRIVDNRRQNLRNVSTSQNHANQRKGVGCSSSFKGVSWHKRDEKWQARIKVNRRGIHIGYFTSEVEAAIAYDSSHKIHFPGIQEGLNFPSASTVAPASACR